MHALDAKAGADEFELIRSFVELWGELAEGIGDDAAVLSVPTGEKLVVSTDAAVEGVHFRRGWITAEEIGYRAAAAALSDLAAMAARPCGLLLALNLPGGWRSEAVAIARGVGAAAARSGCRVIGGNVSSGEQFSLTTTVLGFAAAPLARTGARPGDRVYVTGELGGAAAAVEAWQSGAQPPARARQKFAEPVPRTREALWLAANGATAAIDISDGLAADAGHLARSSKVSITIDAGTVPVCDGATSDHALGGGEDYELLVTAPALDTRAFAAELDLALTEIGSVTAGAEGVDVRRAGGSVPLPAGFNHLSAC